MDFDSIEGGFNGKISVNAMSVSDIQGAIKAFHLVNSVIKYPERYRENLERALECLNSKHADEIEVKII